MTSLPCLSLSRGRCLLRPVWKRRFCTAYKTRASNVTVETDNFKHQQADRPTFKDFLKKLHSGKNATSVRHDDIEEAHPYINEDSEMGSKRKVYFETYGCQMNVSDTEVAWSFLQKKGYQRTTDLGQADVILLVTCSVREKAEKTIWNRLQQLVTLKKKRPASLPPLKIGILGCMAERLKTDLLEREKLLDVLAGPDAYRDLPRLLSLAESGQQAVNVLLSLEETYADVLPVHVHSQAKTAFVSIMRGCDNMCSYCIVPFTRGRERSRPAASILQEVRMLSDQGVKEVTLLGQNVNSYRDTSEVQFCTAEPTHLSKGFHTLYRNKQGGLRFAALLEAVSNVNPEMRIRFTSPHPKDFPDEEAEAVRDDLTVQGLKAGQWVVLQLIHEKHNICKQIHLPAQSGSNRVLQAMRRGYTREAYLELVDHVRTIIPGVSLSSDFIAGFCGETEEDHLETISLMRAVKYNVGYLFAYSMRNKTHAFHRLEDNVPGEVKQRRLEELIGVFREEALKLNCSVVGSTQLILVEGVSKRSRDELTGRTDGNIKVIFPDVKIPINDSSQDTAAVKPGDYVQVKITSAGSQSLKGVPLRHATLRTS